MRRYAMTMTMSAVSVAVLLLGLPLGGAWIASALRTAGDRYERVAATLGASPTRTLFTVTLPLVFPGLLSGAVLSFARALGEFGATLMVAGSIPGKTQTLSIAIYEAVQAGQDDTANLLVLITSIVCVAVLLSAGKLAPGRIAHR